MRKIFVIGLLVKLVIIFLTLHGDLLFVWNGQFNLSAEQRNTEENYYPPLAYITFYILSPIYWLSTKVGFWILKFPYLIFDFAILKILFNLFPKQRHFQIMKLWWLNPIIIYAAYAQGQFEIIPAFLVILSVYLIKSSGVNSVMALAAAGAYKTLPVFSLPPVILRFSQNWKQGLKLLLISLGILIIPGLILWKLTGFDITSSYFPKVATSKFECNLRPDAAVDCLFTISGLLGYLTLLWLIVKKHLKTGIGEVIFISLTLTFIANPANLLHRYALLIPVLIYIVVKHKFSIGYIWWLNLLLLLGYVYTWPLQWGLVQHLWPGVASFPALREFVSGWIKYEHLALLFQALAKLLLFWVAAKSLRCIGNDQASSLQTKKEISARR